MIKKLYKYIAPFVIVGLLFLVLPKTAEAAIAFDATANTAGNECPLGNEDSVSWSHTASGSERLVVVGISLEDATDADRTVTSMTYGAQSMTLAKEQKDDTNNITSSLWYLMNPNTGAQTITANFLNMSNCFGASISFTGAHQTSALDATNGTTQADSTSVSTAVTTVADNSMVVDVMTMNEGSNITLTAGAGQTERDNQTTTATAHGVSHEGPQTPAGSVTMSWSCSGLGCGGNEDWTIAAASFAPAATTATTESSSLVIQKGAVFIEKGQVIIN